MVVDGRVDVVLITYRDRLTRFGYKYLQFFFEKHGVKIEEVFHEKKEALEELIEDFLAIIVSFAGKIYGKRSRSRFYIKAYYFIRFSWFVLLQKLINLYPKALIDVSNEGVRHFSWGSSPRQ